MADLKILGDALPEQDLNAQQQRLATALLAALADPRVSILCVQKDDLGTAKDVLTAIASDNPQVRFEYHNRTDAEKYKTVRVDSLARQINSYQDARALRSSLDDIFANSHAAGLVPSYIARNGFVQYLRSISSDKLIELLTITYMTWYPSVGTPTIIGKGAQRVSFYDNVGQLIAQEGLEIWVKRRPVMVNPRQIDRLLVLAGDFPFPPEIADVGRWGYSVNVKDSNFGVELDHFSPVQLDWQANVLTARDRAADDGFAPAISQKTLDSTYQALDVLGAKIQDRIPNEQVDQRISSFIAAYRDEIKNLEPNPVLLDCLFDAYAKLVDVEGASSILEALNDTFSRTHRAVVSSSPTCRELDRAARLAGEDVQLPHQIIESLAKEIAAAEAESVVDQSVTEVADELVTLDKEQISNAGKRKIVLAGFVKAIASAMRSAPDAVKGMKAFQDLYQMAERAREYIQANWHNWFN